MQTRDRATAKAMRVFDRLADHYDREIGFAERFLLGEVRTWATERAHGDVVEIAIGTGLNLPHYGPSVKRVLGIDLSARMLDIARERVASQGIDRVELRQGDVQALDLPDASADTVVSTLTLCTIPDPAAACRAVYRVLRPGGTFVLAEHGPPAYAAARVLLRALDPLTSRVCADHLMRDPVPYVRSAGFEIVSIERTGRAGAVFRVVAAKPTADGF